MLLLFGTLPKGSNCNSKGRPLTSKHLKGNILDVHSLENSREAELENKQFKKKWYKIFAVYFLQTRLPLTSVKCPRIFAQWGIFGGSWEYWGANSKTSSSRSKAGVPCGLAVPAVRHCRASPHRTLCSKKTPAKLGQP